MSDSGLMNHVKEVPQVGGGCGIVSQTTSTLIISPDSPSLNGSPEATSSGNPPFPTHEQQQIVESEVFTISTTALILDDNDVHSASPADTVSAAAPTSSSSPEFSTISTSTPPTLTTLSRWPTRADAVQAVATFMSYHGKRTFQSSKSCGGEVILLCTGNKGQGNW